MLVPRTVCICYTKAAWNPVAALLRHLTEASEASEVDAAASHLRKIGWNGGEASYAGDLGFHHGFLWV